MTSNDNDELTEYEKLRRSNILERESLFQDVMEAKSKVNKAFARKKRTITRKVDYGPPREKSRRIQKEAAPTVDRTLIPLQTLDFKSFFDYGYYDERFKKGEQFVKQFCQELITTNMQTQTKQYSDSKIRVQSKTDAVVADQNLQSVSVHPTEHKILAGAGTIQGDLVLWDVKEDFTEGYQFNPSVYKFKPHSSVINCQSWDKFNTVNLITSSFDSTCRIFDLNRMESRLLFGNKDFIAFNTNKIYSGAKINTCDMHQQINANEFLISMGRTGCISLVDQRVSHQFAVQEYQVFDAVSAQNISVHPLLNNLVLAANNDGGAFVFDRRNVPNKEDGFLEPIAELVGHESSITSAAFNSSGNKIATMCADNELRLFDSTIVKGLLEGFSLDHPNYKKSHIFGFRGVWHPIHDDVYFAGCPSPMEVRAYRATSVMNQIRTYKGFQGGDLKASCPVLAAHPTLDVLIGGGGKRVQVFM